MTKNQKKFGRIFLLDSVVHCWSSLSFLYNFSPSEVLVSYHMKTFCHIVGQQNHISSFLLLSEAVLRCLSFLKMTLLGVTCYQIYGWLAVKSAHDSFMECFWQLDNNSNLLNHNTKTRRVMPEESNRRHVLKLNSRNFIFGFWDIDKNLKRIARVRFILFITLKAKYSASLNLWQHWVYNYY